MTATRDDIIRWLREATELGATHLIVVCDTFDNGNYALFANSDEDANKIIEEYGGRYGEKDMQKVDEVYSMKMDLLEQLSEERAFNIY